MSLRDHLQAVYDQHGALTPELVVQAARPKNHPLHDQVFDRDQRDAAEAWYRERAHGLIRSVRIVYREADETTPQRSVRAFHAVPAVETPGRFTYVPTDQVIADDLTRQVVLREMEREWRSLLARYEHFEEFLGLVSQDLEMRAAA